MVPPFLTNSASNFLTCMTCDIIIINYIINYFYQLLLSTVLSTIVINLVALILLINKQILFYYTVKCRQSRYYDDLNINKKPRIHFTRASRLLISIMVGLSGLEPPTPAMSTQYSNQLSYKPTLWCRRPESNRYGVIGPAGF